jgi:4-hydroxy-tetrahydrodipicolinate reductase
MSNLAILGCTGRMGRALLEALREQSGLQLSGALASPGNAAIGSRVAGSEVVITADPRRALQGAAVAIDFTLPAALAANLAACVAGRVPLVIGTTGLEAAALDALREAGRTIPIVHSPNMSVGVNVLLGLVEQAARALGRDYDVEIVDIHHRHKRDAPSGTALKLGETIARARGDDFEAVAVRGAREGARKQGQIGFAAVRAGDHVGEHTVTFSASGETVSLSHRATDRLTFARGALQAAHWLIARTPGVYAMHDVIGLKTNT